MHSQFKSLPFICNDGDIIKKVETILDENKPPQAERTRKLKMQQHPFVGN